ncbi:MAG: bifunctional glutamate N-acetyltransferase/amino-acid acetyltransferase ArgJ [Actinobacteria bacterium]|nr:bifunctional glutamate N-acetyltransferase/amino-acid acetyltransferase ArgJ [Actinomycetota bacterium]
MTVTAPQGFRAAGVTAGLKASGRPDLALVVNDGPLQSAAAVFTSNRFPAAPVLWTRQAVADGELHAVVLNSGGANACTGPEGFADTHRTAEHVAEMLSAAGVATGAGEVGVCSTGLIGERLPMDLLLPGVNAAAAALSADGGMDAAISIMTTDTVPKVVTVRGDGFTVGGMAKGAGMLAPGLATMLVVITTDAVAHPDTLAQALAAATRVTFDRIDSDGCMSTNDAVIAMASGAAMVQPTPAALAEAISAACAELALQLIGDAEGASKDIAITVARARTEDDAVEVARAVARSNLLKCAIHGEDPNWGRVLSAIGTTSATFAADQVDVAINDVWVCRDGAAGDARDLVDMTGRTIRIAIDLAAGEAEATVWTNDLTADYVHENSAYST